MAQSSPSPKAPGFARVFLFPALWVLVIPIFSWWFFSHAMAKYDKSLVAGFMAAIDKEEDVSPEDKATARQNAGRITLGKMMDNGLADGMPQEILRDYKMFRWLRRIAVGSVGLTLLSVLLVGGCVLLSLRSQMLQYYCLAIGWNVLKLCGMLQVIAQGVLMVALSFWVTALWFNMYVPKLIFIVGLLVLCGVGMLLLALFKRAKMETHIEGVKLEENRAQTLFARLRSICTALGTEPPTNVIAGIDDNFFVTENPMTVRDKVIKGRTLFVSLPLLKQLSGSEADAVLAHEMAHFSGKDTLYSRKIAPLLLKYDNYLQTLYQNAAMYPVFGWMNCFRALFELSLGKQNRSRELRADALAVEQSSPEDLASALLKIASYASYRTKVQSDLYNSQQVLDEADIGDQIERGFPAFSSKFLKTNDLNLLTTSHPFDSHPTIAQRLQAVGVPF
jgi:Zn-dependent protease with chaperone function